MPIIRIDAADYKEVSEPEKGETSRTELAPYDMPIQVEAKLDQVTGEINIYFNYLDREETTSKMLKPNLKLRVGRHSGKILGLGIAINVKKTGLMEGTIRDAMAAALSTERAVEEEIPKLTRPNERLNYLVISSVLAKNRDPLFANLLTAGPG